MTRPIRTNEGIFIPDLVEYWSQYGEAPAVDHIVPASLVRDANPNESFAITSTTSHPNRFIANVYGKRKPKHAHEENLGHNATGRVVVIDTLTAIGL